MKRPASKARLTRAVRQKSRARKLILAHAAMRRPHDPVQLASLWAGAVATFIVVVLAWWWASKPEFIRILSSPTRNEFQFLKHDKTAVENVAQSFSPKKVGALMNDLTNAATRLDALATQVAREQRTLDRMAILVSTTSSQATLFQTAPSGTSTQN